MSLKSTMCINRGIHQCLISYDYVIVLNNMYIMYGCVIILYYYNNLKSIVMMS